MVLGVDILELRVDVSLALIFEHVLWFCVNNMHITAVYLLSKGHSRSRNLYIHGYETFEYMKNTRG